MRKRLLSKRPLLSLRLCLSRRKITRSRKNALLYQKARGPSSSLSDILLKKLLVASIIPRKCPPLPRIWGHNIKCYSGPKSSNNLFGTLLWVKSGFFVIGWKWPKSGSKVGFGADFCMKKKAPKPTLDPLLGHFQPMTKNPILTHFCAKRIRKEKVYTKGVLSSESSSASTGERQVWCKPKACFEGK